MFEPWIGPNRRRHQRVSLAAPARLLVDDVICAAQCLDLSVGGARLQCEASVPSGTTLELDVEFDATRRARIPSEVVRVDDTSVSVRFVRLDPNSLAAIARSLP
ncbi:MAG: PilZ domain-containing protein [Polyangiaceae bacterium]|nr:PilZ domain-containing protein [Polyangiaceae bacterium]